MPQQALPFPERHAAAPDTIPQKGGRSCPDHGRGAEDEAIMAGTSSTGTHSTGVHSTGIHSTGTTP